MGEVEEMARGVKWGCSYKRTTLVVCSINIVVALFVLRSLYGSLYIYSNHDLNEGSVHTVLFPITTFVLIRTNKLQF